LDVTESLKLKEISSREGSGPPVEREDRLVGRAVIPLDVERHEKRPLVEEIMAYTLQLAGPPVGAAHAGDSQIAVRLGETLCEVESKKGSIECREVLKA
jgi:hypothetical protein